MNLAGNGSSFLEIKLKGLLAVESNQFQMDQMKTLLSGNFQGQLQNFPDDVIPGPQLNQKGKRLPE